MLTRPLQEWLDELVLAAPADRRMVAITGYEHGLALQRVRCDRHDLTLNWTSAAGHLDRSEASHRLHHGTDARLHELGDLRPLGPAEPGARPASPWPLAECRHCRRPIVWAVTSNGRRMPVDAAPAADGNVLLTDRNDPRDRTPAARVVTTVEDMAEAECADLHLPHFATCPKQRRRR